MQVPYGEGVAIHIGDGSNVAFIGCGSSSGCIMVAAMQQPMATTSVIAIRETHISPLLSPASTKPVFERGSMPVGSGRACKRLKKRPTANFA